MEKWLLEQSAVVVLCVAILYYSSKGIAAIYRDWMGRESFAKSFFIQHERIANASVKQVEIGEHIVLEMSGMRGEMLGMKGEMTGMKHQVLSLEEKLGKVEDGLNDLTAEVKLHPPRTKEKA